MSVPILPTGLVQTLERTLRTSVGVATSPFTGTQQVQDLGGEWWEYSFDFKIVKGREARALSAFLAALGGMRGTFLFSDPTIEQASVVGAPVVNGPAQTGRILNSAGWPASSTVMYAGDFFSLGVDAQTRFYQLSADVVTDGVGLAAMSFFPALRQSPIDGDPIAVVDPKVLLRLSGPVPAQISRADTYRFSMTAREAI